MKDGCDPDVIPVEVGRPIPLAVGALYQLKASITGQGVFLSPVFASAVMALSSLRVVANSLRLKRSSPTPIA